jgi:hypothetical protein
VRGYLEIRCITDFRFLVVLHIAAESLETLSPVGSISVELDRAGYTLW